VQESENRPVHETPLPVNPSLHSQLKLPSVLVHTAYSWQLSPPSSPSHSFASSKAIYSLNKPKERERGKRKKEKGKELKDRGEEKPFSQLVPTYPVPKQSQVYVWGPVGLQIPEFWQGSDPRQPSGKGKARKRRKKK